MSRCVILPSADTLTSVRHAQNERQVCRDRVGELLAEDDDPRRAERVVPVPKPDVEVPQPVAGEDRGAIESKKSRTTCSITWLTTSWRIVKLRSERCYLTATTYG